jgi:hypothetical protein
LIPFNPFQKQYIDIVNAQNVNNESATNRLLILSALKMTTGTNPFVNPVNVPDINRVNTLGISLNRNLLFQYLGGPGSAYGIGATTIKRAVDTTRLRSATSMVYDQLASQKSEIGSSNPKLQDFRNQLPGLSGSYIPWGDNTVDKRFYKIEAGKYKDKINLLYPFAFENSVAPWEISGYESDDLIKFVFEAVSNDNTNYSTAIFFRAFLTAGLTDNNSAQLNSFKYMGRGENFYTYQGFDRTIGFSFRVAAGSREELRPMYNRINNLISQVYPDYSPSTSIMRAPLVRVTVGDYLYRVPGFLENVNVTVDNNYPWEVNLEKSKTGDIAQLPQVVDISISFKPIFDILPKRSTFSITQESEVYEGEDVLDVQTATMINPALIANVPGRSKEQSFIKPVSEDKTYATPQSVNVVSSQTQQQNTNQSPDLNTFINDLLSRTS